MWQMISPDCVDEIDFFNDEMKYMFFIPLRFASSNGERPVMLTANNEQWWSNGNKIIDEV